MIRVSVKFNTNEDVQAVETQLSDISGVKVVSLTSDVISSLVDGQWRMERTMAVYGLNITDNSLVSGLDLEKSVEIVYSNNLKHRERLPPLLLPLRVTTQLLNGRNVLDVRLFDNQENEPVPESLVLKYLKKFNIYQPSPIYISIFNRNKQTAEKIIISSVPLHRYY